MLSLGFMTVRRQLPPLPAIRCFEASARHLSFTLAADELCVTQGAISQQVRKLEDYLGKTLFLRKTRQLELTETGLEYYTVCRYLLEDLEKTTQRIMQKNTTNTLTIQTMPTISVLWLMPRLADFATQHPSIEVRVVSDIRSLNMSTDGIDLAIRVGKLPGQHYPALAPTIDLDLVSHWNGVQSDYLFRDRLVPIMARELYERVGPIRSIAELQKVPLIQNSTRANAWRDWFRAHQANANLEHQQIECGHFYIALQLAQSGQGVALVPDVLLQGYPGHKELIQALPDLALQNSAGAYYLLAHDNSLPRPAVSTFRDWLLGQAEITRNALV